MATYRWHEVLVDRWRMRAETYRAYAPGVAAAIDACADELDAELAAWLDARVPIRRAAAEVGRSYTYVKKLVDDGKLENVGGTSMAMVRRRDLFRVVGGAGPALLKREEPDDETTP